jgi:hypothetical protein
MNIGKRDKGLFVAMVVSLVINFLLSIYISHERHEHLQERHEYEEKLDRICEEDNVCFLHVMAD